MSDSERPQKWKRRQKLPKAGLQLKITAAFVAVGVACTMLQAMLLATTLRGQAYGASHDELRLLSEVPRLVATNLMITLALLLPLSLAVGVLVTFRVAGPVKRFEIYLGQVAAGEDTGPCRIRKGDELHELCDVLNRAVGALRAEQPADERHGLRHLPGDAAAPREREAAAG